ncbi:hypothetical protein DFH07DRAFT_780844 [Mycena maculata]|uniref:Uncharacterized protein n=1 Tax=Mycena maculata TaxID=230809 RepID=A0AAD7MUM7_9AGAR|nr:hypothetical protein DFH07DRAFT_780844 [Mycena maculata]
MAKSKGKSKKPEPDAPAKKRGSPSDFQCQRLVFLTERIDDYITASKKGRGKNSSDLSNFWRDLFFDYWRRFPWRLPLSEEPPAEPEAPPANAEEAFRALDLDLTSDEQDEKAKVQRETKDKIKRWFNRQRPGKMGIHGNPYFEYLAKMWNDEGAPRKPTEYHFYMNHPEFKERVRAAGDEAAAKEEDLKKRIAARGKIARKMLAAEPPDVQKRLLDERDAAHRAAMEEYEASDPGLPSVDPAVQAECRENLMATIAPLLSGLNVYTGYLFNIVAVRVSEDGSFDVVSANAGDVGGKDWASWDPTAYGQMLPQFLKFVHANHLRDQIIILIGEAELIGQQPPTPTAGASGSSNTQNTQQRGPDPVADGLICMSPEVNNDKDVDMRSPPLVYSNPPPPVQSSAPPPVHSSAPPPAQSAASPGMGPPPPPPLREDEDDDIMSGQILFAPGNNAAANPPAFPPVVPPMEERDSETWGVSMMTPPLRAELLAMEDDTRMRSLARLRHMPETKVVRENNMALQRSYQAEWGLKSATAFIGMKRKRLDGDESGMQRAKGNKKKKDEEDWDSESEKNEDGDGDEGGDRSSPVPTHSRGKAKAKGNGAAAGPAVPAWAKKARETLEDGGEEMGGEWKRVVDVWWKVEEAGKFTKKKEKGSLSATKRPKQVALWVKWARVGTPTVTLPVFSNEWRWEALRHPGQNGFLNVLVCLKWWHEKLETDAERDEWDRAVDDVLWVLEGILGEVGTMTPMPAPNAPNAPANPGAPATVGGKPTPAAAGGAAPATNTEILPAPTSAAAGGAAPTANAEVPPTPTAAPAPVLVPATISGRRPMTRAGIHKVGLSALIAADAPVVQIDPANPAPPSSGSSKNGHGRRGWTGLKHPRAKGPEARHQRGGRKFFGIHIGAADRQGGATWTGEEREGSGSVWRAAGNTGSPPAVAVHPDSAMPGPVMPSEASERPCDNVT